MALDTTLAGDSTNSYTTLVEARDIVAVFQKIPYYKTLVLNFDANEDDVLEEVLKQATQNIDAFNYRGQRQTGSQLREWPRVGKQLSLAYQQVYPDELKQSQVLEACNLLSESAIINTEAKRDIAAGIQSKSIGKRSVTYKNSSSISVLTNNSELAREILDRANLLSYSVKISRS